ncbi:hypothetical protein GC207_15845 [bacterium]|nr:hypothetical protein [bacterium]
MKLLTCCWRSRSVMKAAGLSAVLLLNHNLAGIATAAPRTPFPPWPEKSLSIFGWDEGYFYTPMRLRAINADQAVMIPSWSGYSLVRQPTDQTPVAIPALDVDGRSLIASDTGAVRWWFNANWSSVAKLNAKEVGSPDMGPGRPARLLELANLGGQFADIRWTLYANAEGNQLRLTGIEYGQVKQMLTAPLNIVAGQWVMLTLCYSPAQSQLWLGGQKIAEGSGIKPGIVGWEDRLGLVIGSSITGGDSANGQFEELVSFDYWPDAEQQQFYYRSYSKRALLGPVGSPEEELFKMDLVHALDGPPAPGEGEGTGGGGGTNSPAYNYTTNDLWLEITGKTNSTGYFVIHEPTTATGGLYDLFSTTNLSPSVSGLNLTNWLWVTRTTSGLTNLTITGLSADEGYFQLGTMLDSDGDGLPDAYEKLVTHSSLLSADTDGDGLADIGDPNPSIVNGPATFAGKTLPYCPQ